MKRTLALLLCGLVLLFAAACSSQPASSFVPSGQQHTLTPEDVGEEGAQIAFLVEETQRSEIFGQAVWAAISRFSGEQGVSCGAYSVQPAEVETALATVETAIRGDARLVVAIGSEMETVVARGSLAYPEIVFLYFEAPEDYAPRDNTVLLHFDEVQAGWLAGYAAVMSGLRSVAYLQAEAETAARYGVGFALGAQAAAGQLLLPAEDWQLREVYLPREQTAMALRGSLRTLFEDEGCELLFVNDMARQPDILRFAGFLQGQVIGVEVPGGAQSSAAASLQRNPGTALYTLLDAWQAGEVPAGEGVWLGLDVRSYSLENYALKGFDEDETVVEAFTNQDFREEVAAQAEALLAGLAQPPALRLAFTVGGEIERRPATQYTPPVTQVESSEPQAEAEPLAEEEHPAPEEQEPEQ